jgi:hypothetical protein
MQSIIVRYIGPSERRGSRYKAICSAGSVTIPLDQRLSNDDAATKAVRALLRKLGWGSPSCASAFVVGYLPNGDRVYTSMSPCDIVHIQLMDDGQKAGGAE